MGMETSAPDTTTEGMRRMVRLAAILNLAYSRIECAVGVTISSVSLFADSIDFLENTSVNFLILLALNWSARNPCGNGDDLYRGSARARGGNVLDGMAQVRSAYASSAKAIALPPSESLA